MDRRWWMLVALVAVSAGALGYSDAGERLAKRRDEQNSWRTFFDEPVAEECSKDEDCEGDQTCKEKKCVCPENELYDKNSKICRISCESDGDCMPNSRCYDDLCKCVFGYEGKDCKTVTGCKTLGKECEDAGGSCAFSKKPPYAKCVCADNKEYDNWECKSKCVNEGDDPCTAPRKCTNKNLCECKEGFIGADCDTPIGCKTLGAVCAGIGATCKYDEAAENNVTCECPKTEEKFDRKTNTCRTPCANNDACINGAACVDGNGAKFCECKKGTSGDACDTVDDCRKEGFCGKDNTATTCEYSVLKGKAVCICKDKSLAFHPGERKCKKPCDDSENKCKNGAECKESGDAQFCECKDGTSGDLCKVVDQCKPELKFCGDGNDVECVYDRKLTRAVCQCKNDTERFNPDMGKCQKPCDDSENKCMNGAECKESGDAKFCKCKDGTSGDLCEAVDQCKPELKFCGDGKDVDCVYDVSSGLAVCQCRDEGNKFHPQEKKCRKTCDSAKDETKCQNGGDCTVNENAKFCKCKEGTSGDLCGVVDACLDKSFCGNSLDTICKYNVQLPGAECSCKDSAKKFHPQKKICKKPCVDKCENGGKCDGGFCSCKDGTSGDLCETVDACEQGLCGTGTDVQCKYDPDKEEASCVCDAGKKFDREGQTCRNTCSEKTECAKGQECTGGLCKCPEGYDGDSCKVVAGCKKLKEVCDKINAECVFDADSPNKATCKCREAKTKYDPDTKLCRDKCEITHDCTTTSTCVDDLCKCMPGYEGRKCDVITGCQQLNCEAQDAKCVLPKKATGPVCECNDKIKTWHEGKCVERACLNNPCKGESKCLVDSKLNIGYCQCNNETHYYYNYHGGECEPVDLCVLRKDKCGSNEVCKDGDCDCAEGFERKDGKCTPKCGDGACFEGADCSDANGFKRCKCKTDFYFDGKKCSDGKCLSEGKCCLDQFKKGDKCEVDEKVKCAADCGYGMCIKKDDKETCECHSSVAELDGKSGKCILKLSVCASNQRTENGSKCLCEGKYKVAEDKITCELVTCADAIAREECKKQGATCASNGREVYDCECPAGLVHHDKQCTDPCSKNKPCIGTGKVCYNGKLKDSAGAPPTKCGCLPGFQEAAQCDQLEKNGFIIRNIPVRKERYETANGFNQVLLNSDLIQSLEKTYQNMNHGYLLSFELSEDVLNCSAWVAFSTDEGLEQEVAQMHTQWRTFNCTGCEGEQLLWPPHLRIEGKSLDGVKIEKMTLCATKDALCGKNSECENNKCSCSAGYQPVQQTIKSTEDYTILQCEDIDECKVGKASCPSNTSCVNLPGAFHCQCKEGFKKKGDPLFWRVVQDKEECVGLCDPNPCGEGTCVTTKNGIDCRCALGVEGSFCNRKSESLAAAKKKTVIVGAILGTLLGLTLIGFFVFYWRIRKNSFSEDFEQVPRQHHAAEMMERRPIRGVVNKSYE